MGTRVSAPFSSNKQRTIPLAMPEATAKLPPPPVTVEPSGNWLPGGVSIHGAAGTALISPASTPIRLKTSPRDSASPCPAADHVGDHPVGAESVLVDPAHHRAEGGAGLLDLALPLGFSHRDEVRRPAVVLVDPTLREGAVADLRENPSHLCTGRLGDEARPADRAAPRRPNAAPRSRRGPP